MHLTSAQMEPEGTTSTSAPLFAGQVAIVTGGADGLGKAIVAMLVVNGASVAIFDVAEQRMLEYAGALQSQGHRVVGFKVDISQEESVRRGFEAFRKEFARLDIMVNCAGVVGPNGVKTTEISVEDFDQVFAVNVRGSFIMTNYSLVEMQKRDYGRILLIASIAGKEGNAGMSAYSSSKGAVIAYAKSVGKEHALTGITVNSLAPATIRTAMLASMDKQQVKALTDKIPMRRCGTVEEVAAITKFIVSKEASFNTGCCFDLSGGRTVY